MNNVKTTRILSITLTLVMMMSMMLVFSVSGSAEDVQGQYTLKVSDLENFPAGGKDNGDYVKAGTNNFFTVIFSEKAAVDSNDKTFSDGQFASKRISWGDKSYVGEEILNVVKIKTAGSGTVMVWWVWGGNVTDSTEVRQVAVFDASGKVVSQTNITNDDAKPDDSDGIKNDLFIAELQIPEAGIYYIGNLGGSNYFYQLQVKDNEDGEAPAARADWANVNAPTITAADNGTGNIVVEANALVGHDGADELLVSMYKDGKLVATKGSVTEKSTHTLVFTPADSGTYTFKAELLREGCESKTSAEVSASFVYVLQAPRLSSATNIGGGSVELKWNAVHEAESYGIFVNGQKIGTAEAGATKHTISGLNIGEEYTFTISAIRGSEELNSSNVTAVVTAERQVAWAFTVYGPSASEDKNIYKGNLNEDGYVNLISSGNGGKIQPTKNDGLAFYYTAVPTDYNFTLRAKVTINTWTLSNGQEGFGLMAMDRLPTPDTDPYDYWNNSYLAGSTKIEYKINPDEEDPYNKIIDNKVVNDAYKKYQMKLGIGSISRTGVTPENIELMSKQDTETIQNHFVSR